MVEAKNMRFSVIHDILPPEMVEKILKLLNIKDLCQAQLICKRWKEIIFLQPIPRLFSRKLKTYCNDREIRMSFFTHFLQNHVILLAQSGSDPTL